MKSTHFKITIIFLLLAISSSAQEVNSNPSPFAVSKHPFSYGGRQLIVGQAIGELEKEYRLLDDGGIYRRMNTSKEFDILGEQTKKNIETAFKSLKDVDFEKINFQHPSKTSYFVIFKQGKKEHKVVWGDPKYPAPESVKKVYGAFMGMIPKTMRL
ncbi:MAG: hypothetical protein MUE30_09060 [Spirosomaceae bacterium]|nr:hypothetical protein [Spirosomataceae bacterium]